VESGSSGAEIYRARSVERGDLFMKVNCVIGGRTATPARFPRPATPVEDMACINKRKKDAASLSLNEMTQETFKVAVELALERLRTACGLEEMGVHTWRERVTTSMPGIGIPVVGDVLMMDAAPGLSLNLLLNDRASDLAFIQTMLSRIDPQEIISMAVHDVLFSEGDRHGGNVHIDERSKLRFIDNDNALGFMFGMRSWYHTRGLDSILVPHTARSNIVMSTSSRHQLGWLDYRCHVPGGKLGTAFPPRLAQCMQRFVDTPPEELRREFLIPRHDQAELLRERARDLLQTGFEQTVERAMAAEKIKYEEEMAKAGKSASTWRPSQPPVCPSGTAQNPETED